MNRRAIMLAVASLVVLVPALDAAARGYGRYANTPPMTPFGPQYDPTTYRQAGGDPALYEQLMLQKMAMMQYKQQQAYMKQLEQYKKQMEQQKKNGKKADTGTGTMDPNTNPFAQVPPFPNATARKKKSTTKKTAKATDTASDKSKTDKSKTDKSKTDSSSKPTTSNTKPGGSSGKTASTTTSSASK